MSFVTVLSSVFALLGGGLLVMAGRECARRRLFVRQSTRVHGVIVALREHREGVEITYAPRVRFQAPSGGEITFESGMSSNPPVGRVGAAVAVRFRSDQPQVAEIDTFLSLWGTTLLFGALGVAFTFVGLGILTGLIPV